MAEAEQTSAVAPYVPPLDFTQMLDPEARGSATAESIREEMISDPKLERIQVVHAAQLFKLPDGTSVDHVKAVIVCGGVHNTHFSMTMEEAQAAGEKSEVDCYSMDAVVPSASVVAAGTAKSATCTACPFNKKAKDRSANEAAWALGKGKACGNYLTLVLQLPGCIVPYQVRFSLANRFTDPAYSTFVQQIGTRRQLHTYEAFVKIGLRAEKGSNQTFSVPTFELLGGLDAKAREHFAEEHRKYRAFMLTDRALYRERSEGGDSEESKAATAAAVKEAAKSGAGM
jgi:hypothetical protein